MGNNFAITVVNQDAETANAHIDSAVAEISRIESLLSTFKPDSQATFINN
ncbi:MAG: FAD:protein FMN transferase, partial [Bacteroidota bacterium]